MYIFYRIQTETVFQWGVLHFCAHGIVSASDLCLAHALTVDLWICHASSNYSLFRFQSMRTETPRWSYRI